MEEGRYRFVALIGTILLHIAVVGWLAASPERKADILRAIDMEVVDLTPPEPEPEPEPEPPPPAPEPEPEPEPDPEPRPRRVTKRPVEAEPQEAQPDEAQPEEAQPEEPPGPRIQDFGEQNFAADGSGASWGMAASHGGSKMGVYRPGAKGGGGGVRPTPPPTPTPRPSWSPVPSSQLSRSPRLSTKLPHRYPDRAKRQFIEGVVILRIELRANGRVRRVTIERDPGGGLGEAAAAEMRSARFEPARNRAGQSVDVIFSYRYRYILED